MSEITYIRGDATAPSVKGVKPGIVRGPSAYGRACDRKGRGELRGQPHTSVTHPPSSGTAARGPGPAAERPVAVTIYDHGEAGS